MNAKNIIHYSNTNGTPTWINLCACAAGDAQWLEWLLNWSAYKEGGWFGIKLYFLILIKSYTDVEIIYLWSKKWLLHWPFSNTLEVHQYDFMSLEDKSTHCTTMFAVVRPFQKHSAKAKLLDNLIGLGLIFFVINTKWGDEEICSSTNGWIEECGDLHSSAWRVYLKK